MLAAPAVVPPIVLLVGAAGDRHAVAGVAQAGVPPALVPMKLPCDHVARRAGAGDARCRGVAAIVLAAPVVVPPIVLLVRRRRSARRRRCCPGRCAAGVGADEVAQRPRCPPSPEPVMSMPVPLLPIVLAACRGPADRVVGGAAVDQPRRRRCCPGRCHRWRWCR